MTVWGEERGGYIINWSFAPYIICKSTINFIRPLDRFGFIGPARFRLFHAATNHIMALGTYISSPIRSGSD